MAGGRRLFVSAYARLLAAQGPLQWWPAQTPFEVMVGAILTQNTSWRNVELSLKQLRARRWLNARTMRRLSVDELAPVIRSSGYFNQKARRLLELCRWFEGYGFSVARLRRAFPPPRGDELRHELLALHGVGPETADSILCYAFGLPYFVVDAYTVRWLQRYAPERATHHYEALRHAVENEFRGVFPETELVGHFNEFHAQLVRLGSRICTAREPDCKHCPLRRSCARDFSGGRKVVSRRKKPA